MESRFITCTLFGTECFACGWQFAMCSCEEDFEGDYKSYKKECED